MRLPVCPGRIAIAAIAAILSACGGSVPVSTTAVTPTDATNHAPTISGQSAATVTVGASYSFTPSAGDADGNPLTYSIENKPSWATFNASTGGLGGTPSAADVGTYVGILISVSDGKISAWLPVFSVRVVATSATGTATLSWAAPTQNVDGSALTNLAGYWIFEGSSPYSLLRLQQVANPAATSQTVVALGSGTHYFALAAYSLSGAESELSNTASKQIP